MIGVSRKQVKQAASDGLLSAGVDFRLTLTPGRPRKAALAKLDHLIVVAPTRPPAALWRELPGLKPLQARIRRLGKTATGRALRGMLGTSSTAVTLGLLPAATEGSNSDLPNTFKLLKFAGELVADVLTEEPRSVGLIVHGIDAGDAARIASAVVLALGARSFQPPAFRKEKRPAAPRKVQLFDMPQEISLQRTLAEIEGGNLVRWLTALPANKLTATAYRELLATLAVKNGWDFEWLDEPALAKLGAGAFLAVAQGNAGRDAGIARLRYRPGGKSARPDLALVGKGIIFDTGGTNTKGAVHMLDMHTDMSGSAVSLAVLQALTTLESPLAVDCWLAITENRSGPNAYKQRDVITASNGVTVEVMHTDAEGRMVLADTLALAGRDKPRLMIDFATLTGACVHALSERYSGIFSNRDSLHELLIRVGRESGERVWPFPMDEDFDDDLKSKVADIGQCSSSGEADQILAARFLQRFVPEGTPWIHMDLASATRKDGLGHVPGGCTGFGVRYTVALLLDHAADLHELASPVMQPRHR
ncbi:MAG: leucyl aminopeptidase family protein [Gammaproteobacteria bacterium]|nr:leucyl aminopeptidase family protein [Gammaproteobacteria bacterium]